MKAPDKCPRCGEILQGSYLGGLCHRCVANALLPDFEVLDPPPNPESQFAEPDDLADESADQIIGRYKLLRKIGEGGCGLVYEAEQTQPVQRKVAIKLIKLGMDTKQVIARFQAERQALAMMDHPGIARVFDAGETEKGRPYFVMELVDGIKITEFCDQQRLTPQARLKLFMEVCHAIQHAHQKGVIHRDIKPSNVLVTVHNDRPTPKVIDFGIAKAIEGELTEATFYTHQNQFVGTPAYMSPEQAGQSGQGIDTRSDIYSLGVLLYEILTGRPPFEEKELLSQGLNGMCATILQKEPTRPSTKLRGLPGGELTTTARQRASDVPSLLRVLQGDLDWIVMKCLEKDRARRYETANGLAADINRHLNNEPVTARPPSAAYKFRKAWRRNRATFAALAAIGIILLVSGIVSTWQAIRATDAEERATADADRARRAEQAAINLAAKETLAREEANQRTLEARLNLYGADLKLAQLALETGDFGQAMALLNRHKPRLDEPDIRGFEWRYLRQRIPSDELASLTLDGGSIWDLDISSDGQWLATANETGINLVNIASWPETLNILNSAYPMTKVEFSPDSAQLLTRRDRRIQIWDLLSKEPELLLDEASSLGALSPDGKTLVSDREEGLQIRDFPSLKLLHNLQGQNIRLQWGEQGDNMVISGDSSRMAALIEDTSTSAINRFTLRVWELEEMRAKGSSADVRIILHPEMGSVIALALDHKGDQVAVATTLGLLGIWDTATGQLMASHRDISGARNHRLIYPPGHDLLVGARSDQSIRTWRLTGTNLVETGNLVGHLSALWGLGSTPDGTRLASGDANGVLKIWDMAKLPHATAAANSTNIIPGHLNHLQFLSDNRTLTAHGGSLSQGFLTFWDIAYSRPKDVISNVLWRMAVRVAPDERSVAIARENGLVEVVDVVTHRILATLRGASSEIRCMFFTPDGGRILGASPTRFAERGEIFVGDPILRQWDTTSGRLILETNLSGKLSGMILAPDGKTLGVQLEDGTVEVRRTEDFSLVFQNRHRNIGGPAAAWSPDGRWLAVSSLANNEIRVWDMHTQELKFDLRGHQEIIHDLAFTPDSRTLASASHDRTVILWNILNGQELISLPQAGGVIQATFSNDGRILALGTYLSQGTKDAFNVHLIHAPSYEDFNQRDANMEKGVLLRQEK